MISLHFLSFICHQFFLLFFLENRFDFLLCVAGAPNKMKLRHCSVPAVKLMSNNSAGSNRRTGLFNKFRRELVQLT